MAYVVKGKQDTAIWALNQGEKDGGFRDALLEYNWNIMVSCEKNAVLFTNGDMDTYPMLYLQLIDEYRTDINVLNLSLLNTAWYIKLSKDNPPGENSIPIGLSDTEIDSLPPVSWKAEEFMIEIFKNDGQKNGEMRWTVKPTFSDSLLRVQDLMVMHIIQNNRWKRPLYFSKWKNGFPRWLYPVQMRLEKERLYGTRSSFSRCDSSCQSPGSRICFSWSIWRPVTDPPLNHSLYSMNRKVSQLLPHNARLGNSAFNLTIPGLG